MSLCRLQCQVLPRRDLPHNFHDSRAIVIDAPRNTSLYYVLKVNKSRHSLLESKSQSLIRSVKTFDTMALQKRFKCHRLNVRVSAIVQICFQVCIPAYTPKLKAPA
jgi:hypothetical protein